MGFLNYAFKKDKLVGSELQCKIIHVTSFEKCAWMLRFVIYSIRIRLGSIRRCKEKDDRAAEAPSNVEARRISAWTPQKFSKVVLLDRQSDNKTILENVML